MDNIHNISGIMINGVLVRVTWVNRPKVGNSTVFGCFHPMTSRIVMDKKLPPLRARMILAHELTHAATELMAHETTLAALSKAASRVGTKPIDIEEIFAAIVEIGLYHMFDFSRNNPSIVWSK